MNASKSQQLNWPVAPLSTGDESAAWFELWKAELTWQAKVASSGVNPPLPDPDKTAEK
jgi:hypothetical protein